MGSRTKEGRQARKALGLCADCPEPVLPGKYYGAICAKRRVERAAKATEDRILDGHCRDCSNDPEPDRTRCKACLARQRNRYKRIRESSLLEKASVLHTESAGFNSLDSHPTS